MAFTEVTSTGWLGRIGDSIKGMLFGVILILVSLGLTVFNEKNAVEDIRANKELASKVITVPSEAVESANEGQLVHLNGAAKTDDRVTNKDFGIDVNAVRLSWESELYQWVEEEDTETKKKLGGGEETVTTYSYRKKWVGGPVDSSNFKEAGHDNRGKNQFRDGSSQASKVTVGAFTMAGGMISQMSWADPYPLEVLPEPLAEKGTIDGGVYYSGNPGSPEIGDERVTFEITHPDDVTLVGVQKGESFTAFKAKNGKQKLLLYRGLLTAEEVVAEEKKKAMILRWALRGLGVFLMFVGFTLLLKPLSVLADVIPLLGSLVGGAGALISLMLSVGISSVVMAVSWLAFRPAVAVPLLVLGGTCFVILIVKLVKGRKQAELPPPPPPVVPG